MKLCGILTALERIHRRVVMAAAVLSAGQTQVLCQGLCSAPTQAKDSASSLSLYLYPNTQLSLESDLDISSRTFHVWLCLLTCHLLKEAFLRPRASGHFLCVGFFLTHVMTRSYIFHSCFCNDKLSDSGKHGFIPACRTMPKTH